MNKSIYDLVTTEKSFYETTPVPIFDNYDWNMYEHIKQSVFYKNSQYTKGKGDRPFKNIIRPILNVQYRAEGFNVTDIEPYINNRDEYYKSFLIRKFHDRWAYKNSIDTFVDQMVEAYVDFGGVLVKRTKEKPIVVPWQRIAFVDQTDVLNGPICEKHYYSPDEFKREAATRGWDNAEEVLTFAEANKQTKDNQQKTPGKYIEVYEIHGVFPETFINEEGDEDKYSEQLHVITYYQSGKEKKGITLYSGPKKSPFKFLARDAIYGRALGLGGAEELFEPQIWLNYDTIRIKEMLDQASKILYQTADSAFKTRNRTENLSQGEILVHEQGGALDRINNTPININAFTSSVEAWENNARLIGSATDPVLGEQPPSGTPFRLQALITQQATSIHEYRKGKLATFLGEIYRDWIIPDLKREIVKGDEFMEELDSGELNEVADRISKSLTNEEVKERVLNGEAVYNNDTDLMREEIKRRFIEEGNHKLIKIIKDEFKDSPLDVRVNVAGKQKDLTVVADKLTNVFRQLIASPQVLQDPNMRKLFDSIMEASGLSPLSFSAPLVQQPIKPELTKV